MFGLQSCGYYNTAGLTMTVFEWNATLAKFVVYLDCSHDDGHENRAVNNTQHAEELETGKG